jgi:hypothetical protein
MRNWIPDQVGNDGSKHTSLPRGCSFYKRLIRRLFFELAFLGYQLYFNRNPLAIIQLMFSKKNKFH